MSSHSVPRLLNRLRHPHLGWKYHAFTLRPFNRHSLILTFAGCAYTLTGANYVLASPTSARQIALAVALQWFPLEFWGMLFIFVGLLTMLSSRWPRLSDSWGYAILTALSAGWSATYAAGVIFEKSPVANLTGTVQWGLLAFLWWAIPGLVTPDKTVVAVVKENGEQRRDS
jgi:hypothetical protein